MSRMEDIKAWEERPWVPLMNESFIGWKRLPIENIRPDPASIHAANRYDEPVKSFGELVASIAGWGMAESIIVAKMGASDYLIIDGVRRFRAAMRLGQTTLVCMVYGALSEDDRRTLRTLIYFRGMDIKKKARKELKENERRRAEARTLAA
jgi:ParB-like chromosome segregation protein Spo0J